MVNNNFIRPEMESWEKKSKINKAIYYKNRYGTPIIFSIVLLIFAIAILFVDSTALFTLTFKVKLVLSILFLIAIPIQLILYYKIWYPLYFRGAKKKLRGYAFSKAQKYQKQK